MKKISLMKYFSILVILLLAFFIIQILQSKPITPQDLLGTWRNTGSIFYTEYNGKLVEDHTYTYLEPYFGFTNDEMRIYDTDQQINLIRRWRIVNKDKTTLLETVSWFDDISDWERNKSGGPSWASGTYEFISFSKDKLIFKATSGYSKGYKKVVFERIAGAEEERVKTFTTEQTIADSYCQSYADSIKSEVKGSYDRELKENFFSSTPISFVELPFNCNVAIEKIGNINLLFQKNNTLVLTLQNKAVLNLTNVDASFGKRFDGVIFYFEDLNKDGYRDFIIDAGSGNAMTYLDVHYYNPTTGVFSTEVDTTLTYVWGEQAH